MRKPEGCHHRQQWTTINYQLYYNKLQQFQNDLKRYKINKFERDVQDYKEGMVYNWSGELRKYQHETYYSTDGHSSTVSEGESSDLGHSSDSTRPRKNRFLHRRSNSSQRYQRGGRGKRGAVSYERHYTQRMTTRSQK